MVRALVLIAACICVASATTLIGTTFPVSPDYNSQLVAFDTDKQSETILADIGDYFPVGGAVDRPENLYHMLATTDNEVTYQLLSFNISTGKLVKQSTLTVSNFDGLVCDWNTGELYGLL